MKFQSASFVLGVGVAVTLMSSRHRLRPVVVEIAALGVHMARLGRALVERQVEHAEDLWAEVTVRVREREVGAHKPKAKAAEARPNGPSRAPNGAPARAKEAV